MARLLDGLWTTCLGENRETEAVEKETSLQQEDVTKFEAVLLYDSA